MKKPQPDSRVTWTVDQLVEALHRLRDAWTTAGLELRDIQFELDSAKRRAAHDFTHDILEKVK